VQIVPEYVLISKISRRVVLNSIVGVGALSICRGRSRAQSINTISNSGGCWISAQEAYDLGANYSNIGSYVSGNEDIILKTGNGTFDRALARSLAKLTATFGVVPGFAFFGEESRAGANAYATPEIKLDRNDGTVLFGKYLFRSLLAKPNAPDAAILAVCAHEYGHIVQNNMNVRRRLLDGQNTVKRLELHADFLAGYFAGLRKKENANFAAAIFAVTMHDLGDFNTNSKGHHGTPDERAESVQEGFKLGTKQDMRFLDVVERGIQYVGA
jgi:hypothetical protein